MSINVTLCEITKDNWETCIQLQVAPEQRSFVASNLYSLAESKFYDNMVPLGVYADETMVGFAMYALDLDDGNYWIYRLMIDAKHQGRGYAKAALRQIIGRLSLIPGCTKIVIGYKPDNKVAEGLYGSLGFRPTGQMLFGETIAELPIHLHDNSVNE